MPRTDLVIEVIRAGAAGDVVRLRETAERMISEERAKKHPEVAEKIAAALATKPANRAAASVTVSRSHELGAGGPLVEKAARRPLGSVRLPAPAAEVVRSLIAEQSRANELRDRGLEPRNRLLLLGPPGNGKTSLAEAIAAELGRIFLVVRYDGLVASFLGETSSRLRKVFDLARSVPCVLFFDELDAIAKERSDANETGEIKRTLTSLLMQIDELPSTCLLVAATNHPNMLDDAVWRRFQVRLQIPQPEPDEIRSYFRDALTGLGEISPKKFEALTNALVQASYADAEELALSVRRRAVLDGKLLTLDDIAEAARSEWMRRSPPTPSAEFANGAQTSPKTAKTRRSRAVDNNAKGGASRLKTGSGKPSGKARRAVSKSKKRS